jgi:hypothetical protein
MQKMLIPVDAKLPFEQVMAARTLPSAFDYCRRSARTRGRARRETGK